jgi:hypothetical protein
MAQRSVPTDGECELIELYHLRKIEQMEKEDVANGFLVDSELADCQDALDRQ